MGTLLVFMVVASVAAIAVYSRYFKFHPTVVIFEDLGVQFNCKTALHNTASEDFSKAMRLACEALTKHFSPQCVSTVLNGCVITVREENQWIEGGIMVGGTDYPPKTITVGADMTALVHEFLHTFEYAEGNPDHDHVTWGNKGFWVVDSNYREALFLATTTKNKS